MGPAKDLSAKIKTALVTGGGGFVGGAVVRRLLKEGIVVRVVGRSDYPELSEMGVDCCKGSIADTKFIKRATKDVDIVFHIAALAGIWGPWRDYYTTNVLGTENVISGCRENRVPLLVYTSTPSVVFNRDDIEGQDESLGYAEDFLCHYAKSKVIAEKMVLKASSATLKTVALRPHLIWGPGDPHLLPRLIDKGRKKSLKRVGGGHNLVDISYIDNVAEAHILAAINIAGIASADGKAYFISQQQPVNLWDWINDLFDRLGIDKITKEVSFTTAYRAGLLMEKLYLLLRLKKEPKMTRFLAEQLAKSHYFATHRAADDLGYKPLVSTEEGLRRTIAWLKKQ
jgi:nucleoside-diphosphate-sugar epimerase